MLNVKKSFVSFGLDIAFKKGMVARCWIIFSLFFFYWISHAQVEAAIPNFDSCVNSLYAFGGLSKAEGRKQCLQGLSQEVLDCQNKRFLVQFQEPMQALKSCLQNPSPGNFREHNYYRGHSESFPQPSQRKTVCSITVNSDDERETFRRELNPFQYSWVELLPQNVRGFEGRFIPRDDTWLKRACEQKVKCDILVISGHFASTFLGSSGYEVRLEDLTKFSCKQECKELFDSVQQVYLFGCNTLSEKGKDSRTISQYREILVVDGVSPHQAQRIAARRYTPYGPSIREEIRRVFPKATQVLGYAGPGPTGPSVKGTLKSYLKTAYNPSSSEKEQSENFKRTLGRTGMIQTTGLPRTAESCQVPQKNIRSIETGSREGLQNYVERFARELPVPALDLIVEAERAHQITGEDRAMLTAKVIEKFKTASLKEQRQLLCPIVLTEHAKIVNPALQCQTDAKWL